MTTFASNGITMKTITPVELKQKLDQGQAVLIDVREPGEHQAESIDGACLIPLGEISNDKLPPHTNQAIVLHCRSGKRSTDACHKLLQQNPNLDVYSLEGGILAWQQSGFAVNKHKSNCISIERQTQVVSGGLVVTSCTLGWLVAPVFFCLASFVGLGLMFAGLTGWCGMARLLTSMPWNQ